MVSGAGDVMVLAGFVGKAAVEVLSPPSSQLLPL